MVILIVVGECDSGQVGRLKGLADGRRTPGFLAAPEAGFITGQTLVIDGGQVLPEGA